jgi:ATP-dependent helicase/nuclease subunit B
MGLTVVTSAASHYRVACGEDWLKARASAEEVLIIGATLGAANEIARSLVQTKGASFGYHRMTLGQLASTLARPALTAQRTVPLGALGIQAIANRAIHKLSEVSGLGRYAKLTNGPGFARAIANVITELRLEQLEADALAHLVPDLCPLLKAYEEELAEHGFADWPGVLRLAASAAADHEFRHQLLGLPALPLDVPVMTASDLVIVHALCSRAPEMLVTVPANDANVDTPPIWIERRNRRSRFSRCFPSRAQAKRWWIAAAPSASDFQRCGGCSGGAARRPGCYLLGPGRKP